MQSGALGKVYQNGETIIRQGQMASSLYIIQDGQVEVVIEENGQPVRLAVREAGQPIGELEIFGGQPSLATVRALGQARILTVDKTAFLRRIQQDPSLAYFMLEAMSSRVRELSTTLALLEQHQPEAAATRKSYAGNSGARLVVRTGKSRSTSNFELRPVRPNKAPFSRAGGRLALGRSLTWILRSAIQVCLLVFIVLAMRIGPVKAQEPRLGQGPLDLPVQSGQSGMVGGTEGATSTIILGSSQLLGNPGFENNGWWPWESYGTPALDTSSRHSGSQSAHLGNTDNASDLISQMVTIPANVDEVTMDFWNRLDTSESIANSDYFCYGLWSQDGTTALVQRCWDLATAGSRGWSRETYNLTASERAGVEGQTVLMAFIVLTNADQPSHVWLDDTGLTVAISPAQPPTGQHKLFLPVVVKSPAIATPPPPSGENGAFWLPDIDAGNMLSTYGTSVAVDNHGGIHVGYALYSGHDNGQRPAYYAYCATNCANLASWSLTRLSDHVQDVRLALDPLTGHPRMMLFTSETSTAAHDYQYAACETNCSSSASWTIAVITTNYEIPSRRTYHNNHYFALDPWGGAAFVYTDSGESHSGTFYAHCSSTCTNAGNWSESRLFEQSLGKPTLTFTPNGQPRLAASFYVPDDPQYDLPLWKLFYGGCYSNCSDPPQSLWAGTFIFPMIGDGSFSLALEANGQPRLALYPTAADLSQLQPGQLYYLWCDGDTCLTSPTGWNKASVGTPINYGDGVDLVLDPANQPRMAYQMGDDGLGYAWCNGSCGITSSWQTRAVESTAAIMAKYPPGLPQHQSCPILTWLNGVRPSLALDSAGNPRVGYDTELWWGGSSPDVTCDIGVPVARFALYNQP